MTILTKIKKNEDIYEKVFSDLLEVGEISSFKIGNECYEKLIPFQAAALQKLGVELEFYGSSNTLYSYIPVVPKGTKVTKIKGGLEMSVDYPEILDRFVAKLERKLKGGEK